MVVIGGSIKMDQRQIRLVEVVRDGFFILHLLVVDHIVITINYNGIMIWVMDIGLVQINLTSS